MRINVRDSSDALLENCLVKMDVYDKEVNYTCFGFGAYICRGCHKWACLGLDRYDRFFRAYREGQFASRELVFCDSRIREGICGREAFQTPLKVYLCTV